MIFFSYSHHDQAPASQMIRELRRVGLEVWQDVKEVRVGSLIPVEVSSALSQCSGFCVLITSNSISSNWVRAELSAAFMRWTRDPSFTIVPIVQNSALLPAILSGMYYVDASSLSPEEIAAKISQGIAALEQSHPRSSLDWDGLLAAIESDQFCEEPSSHRYGGWSKSFSVNYLPLAFPAQIPDTVSRIDSISATHWAVRGLCSMKRILMTSGEDSALINRIERTLLLSRGYLMRHFDGQAAGLIRSTAEGERTFPDVRHSATFVKAMLQLRCEPIESIQKAIEFALCNFELNDHRLSSYAEVYHLIGLIEAYPEIYPSSIAQETIRRHKDVIERSIFEMSNEFEVGRDSIRLLGHPGQWHMSPYYSWWVLDACGELLLQSDNARVSELTSEILRGLEKLRIINRDGSIAYPLSLGGASDLGASAQIAEVLLRLSPRSYAETAAKVAEFISKRITREYLAKYVHHELLWAVPHFWERYSSFRNGVSDTSNRLAL